MSKEILKNSKLFQTGISFALDSCSIVLLQKTNVLRQFAQINHLVISQEISHEINNSFCDDITDNKIIIPDNLLNIYECRSGANPQTPKLSRADASVVALYHQYHLSGIISDDGMLCRHCRDHGIDHLNTPMVLLSMLVNGVLSDTDFNVKLKEVFRIGWYSVGVRNFVTGLYAETLDNV